MGSQVAPGCRVWSRIKINTWRLQHDNAVAQKRYRGTPRVEGLGAGFKGSGRETNMRVFYLHIRCMLRWWLWADRDTVSAAAQPDCRVNCLMWTASSYDWPSPCCFGFWAWERGLDVCWYEWSELKGKTTNRQRHESKWNENPEFVDNLLSFSHCAQLFTRCRLLLVAA